MYVIEDPHLDSVLKSEGQQTNGKLLSMNMGMQIKAKLICQKENRTVDKCWWRYGDRYCKHCWYEKWVKIYTFHVHIQWLSTSRTLLLSRFSHVQLCATP